ncbi:MAG TPA: preprotein translocase subunit SecG [Planctomycetota bacterium]|nr:preprotein translocase subunit SecG [Planctomycetota bacterium]
METFLFVLAIVLWPLCLMIIGLILLQGGAGDLSSAFGGGGQLDSTLGVGAGRKMSKLTGWLAIAFLVSVTLLAIRRDVNVSDLEPSAAGATSTAPIDATGDNEATNTPNSPAIGVPVADGQPVEGLMNPSADAVTDPAAPVVPAPAAPVPAVPEAAAPAAPAPAEPEARSKLSEEN